MDMEYSQEYFANAYVDLSATSSSSDSWLSGSVSSPTPPDPISPSWLEKKGSNWHTHTEEWLQKFMEKNDFYHYRKSNTAANRLLGEASDGLKQFFDRSDWDGSKHDGLLLKKIVLKVGRIRNVENCDNLRIFARAAKALEPKHHGEALEILLQRVDPKMAREAMDAVLGPSP